MTTHKKPGLRAVAALPLLAIALFGAASLYFAFALGEASPVPVFMTFAAVWSVCMMLSAVLPGRGKTVARLAAMFFVGSFLMVLAGFLGRNNFQIEGFFFEVFSGMLGGAIVHFGMAKIVGPLLTGRSWCGWGCWTGMILDLLPYKRNVVWQAGNLPRLRAVHFALALGLTATLAFGFSYTIVQTDPEAAAAGMGTLASLGWFAVGNALYYAACIALAIRFKDNRAFCKYLCPVTVFLRTGARVALARIRGDAAACTSCGRCAETCPMGVDVPAYVKEGRRVASTECILCLKCVSACPEAALKVTAGFDRVRAEHLRRAE